MTIDDLFGNEADSTIHLLDEGMNISYSPAFLNKSQSDLLFSELLSAVPWRQPEIWMFGRKVKIPRLTAWYGDEGAGYVYSGIKNDPLPWTTTLQNLRERVEKEVGSIFNSVLLNLYRDGNDHLSWHSDNEKELGVEPLIASVSLGAERVFSLRSDIFNARNSKYDLLLQHGSLVCMKGKTQVNWLHAMKKNLKVKDARINLTFRQVRSALK